MPPFSDWIFLEALYAVCVPGKGEITLLAMKLFGGYAMLMPLLVAMSGAALGGGIVWGLGRLLERVRRLRPETLSEFLYVRLSGYARRYGWAILPFYGLIPLGGLLPVMAGFFRLPWWMVAIVVATGRGLLFLIKGV